MDPLSILETDWDSSLSAIQLFLIIYIVNLYLNIYMYRHIIETFLRSVHFVFFCLDECTVYYEDFVMSVILSMNENYVVMQDVWFLLKHNISIWLIPLSHICPGLTKPIVKSIPQLTRRMNYLLNIETSWSSQWTSFSRMDSYSMIYW